VSQNHFDNITNGNQVSREQTGWGLFGVVGIPSQAPFKAYVWVDCYRSQTYFNIAETIVLGGTSFHGNVSFMLFIKTTPDASGPE